MSPSEVRRTGAGESNGVAVTPDSACLSDTTRLIPGRSRGEAFLRSCNGRAGWSRTVGARRMLLLRRGVARSAAACDPSECRRPRVRHVHWRTVSSDDGHARARRRLASGSGLDIGLEGWVRECRLRAFACLTARASRRTPSAETHRPPDRFVSLRLRASPLCAPPSPAQSSSLPSFPSSPLPISSFGFPAPAGAGCGSGFSRDPPRPPPVFQSSILPLFPFRASCFGFSACVSRVMVVGQVR
jgi:hypothetical protein